MQKRLVFVVLVLSFLLISTLAVVSAEQNNEKSESFFQKISSWFMSFLGIGKEAQLSPGDSVSDGLIEYYSFDSVGNDSANYVGGKSGLAYNFVGNNYVATTLNRDFKDDFTVSLWAKPSMINEYYGVLWSIGENTGNNPALIHGGGGGYTIDNKLYFLSPDCGSQWVETGYEFTDTSWHNIIVEKGGDEYRFYVDGVQTQNIASASGCSSTSGVFNIGYQKSEFWTSGYYYNGIYASRGGHYYGLIDEVRVYNRALSTNEIQTLAEFASNISIACYQDSDCGNSSTAYFCMDDSWVYKNITSYACNNSGTSQSSCSSSVEKYVAHKICQAGTVCRSGECVTNQTNYTCVDRDNGLNYNLSSSVFIPEINTSYVDYCSDSDPAARVVVERYCSNTTGVVLGDLVRESYYTCPNGCSNGACNSQPQNQTDFIPITSCRAIDSFGTYVLTQDISTTGPGDCITIKANNVILDGNNHEVIGQGGYNGIYSESTRNITIKNFKGIKDFYYGIIFLNFSSPLYDSQIINNSLQSNFRGAFLRGYNVLIRDNTISSNDDYGLAIISDGYGESRLVTIESNSFVNNIGSGLLAQGKNFIIKDNLMNSNKYIGASMILDNSLVEANEFNYNAHTNKDSYNGYGLEIRGGVRTNYTKNSMNHNSIGGLHIISLAYNNSFDSNDLCQNGLHDINCDTDDSNLANNNRFDKRNSCEWADNGKVSCSTQNQTSQVISGCDLISNEIKQEVAQLQSSGKTVVLEEGEKILEDEYVVIPGYLLQLMRIYNNTGADYTRDAVTFKDVISGEVIYTIILTEGSGRLDIGGMMYEFIYQGSGEEGFVWLNFPQTSGRDVMSFENCKASPCLDLIGRVQNPVGFTDEYGVFYELTQNNTYYNLSWWIKGEEKTYTEYTAGWNANTQTDHYYQYLAVAVFNDPSFNASLVLEQFSNYPLCVEREFNNNVVYVCSWSPLDSDSGGIDDSHKYNEVMWANGNVMVRSDVINSPYTQLTNEEISLIIAKNTQVLVNNLKDNKYQGVYSKFDLESHLSWLVEENLAECSSSLQQGIAPYSFDCKLEPVICPEYGEQKRICTSWLDREFIKKESTMRCSPGICSGCYVPRWFNYYNKGQDNICMPYGTRFIFEDGRVSQIYQGQIVEELITESNGVINATFEIRNDGTAYIELYSDVNLLNLSNGEIASADIYFDGSVYNAKAGESLTIYPGYHQVDITYYDAYGNKVFSDGVAFEIGRIVYNSNDNAQSYIEVVNRENYPAYCDVDGRVKRQRDKEGNDWAKCQNNYECESNICSYGECVNTRALAQEAAGFKVFVVKVLCRLSNFLDNTGYDQCVAQYSP